MKLKKRAYGLWFMLGAPILFVIVMVIISNWWRLFAAPKINPHPKHIVTLEGYISPKLKNKTMLKFSIYYIGKSSRCEHFSLSYVLIGDTNPDKTMYFYPRIDKSGKYTIKIPLDNISPGYCNWTPMTLDMALSNSKDNFFSQTIINLNNKNNDKNNPKILNIICNDRLQHCKTEPENNTLMPIVIDKVDSYKLTLNIIKRK